MPARRGRKDHEQQQPQPTSFPRSQAVTTAVHMAYDAETRKDAALMNQFARYLLQPAANALNVNRDKFR